MVMNDVFHHFNSVNLIAVQRLPCVTGIIQYNGRM